MFHFWQLKKWNFLKKFTESNRVIKTHIGGKKKIRKNACNESHGYDEIGAYEKLDFWLIDHKWNLFWTKLLKLFLPKI